MILAQNNYDKATTKALEALYVQAGWKDNTDRFVKGMERKYIPVVVKRHGGWMIFLVESFTKEEVRLVKEWEF